MLLQIFADAYHRRCVSVETGMPEFLRASEAAAWACGGARTCPPGYACEYHADPPYFQYRVAGFDNVGAAMLTAFQVCDLVATFCVNLYHSAQFLGDLAPPTHSLCEHACMRTQGRIDSLFPAIMERLSGQDSSHRHFIYYHLHIAPCISVPGFVLLRPNRLWFLYAAMGQDSSYC